MTLTKQTISLNLLQTLQQDVSKNISQQPLVVENLICNKVGSLEKRFGYDLVNLQILGSTSSIENIKHISQRQGEMLAFTESGVYKYVSSLDRFIQVSRSVVTEVDKTSIVRNNYNQSYAQMSKVGSNIVTVYRDSRGGYRYSAYDESSKALIKNDVSLGTIHNPQFLYFLDKLYLFYVRNSDNNISFRQIDTQTFNVGAETLIGSAITSALKMFRVSNTDSKFCVVFIDASDDVGVSFHRLDGSLTGNIDAVPNKYTLTETMSGGFNFVLEESSGWNVRIAWSDESDIFLARYTPTGAEDFKVTLDSVTNLHAVSFSFDTDLFIVWDETSATPQDYTLYAAKYELDGTQITAKYLLGSGLGLTSEAFIVDDIRYCALTYTSVYQPNIFVLSEYGNVAAKFNKDKALQHRTENIMIQPYVDGAVVSIPMETRTILGREGDFFTQTYGISIFDIEYGSINTSTVELENTLYTSGSVVKAYDGATFCEAGFLLRPEESVTSVVSTATRATLAITSTGKLTFTSVAYGTGANSITVAFTTGGTAGAEVVTVVGSAISVQIQSGVSTSAQIKTAIEASAPAMALVSVVKNTDGAMVAVVAANLTGGTGGSLSSGSYQYIACYAWTDNFGNVHRSSADLTAAISYSAVANDAVNITVPTLFVTDKSNVIIEIYRTKAADTVFYFAGYVINDTSSKYTVYNDTNSDASLADNEKLYIEGNVLSNDSFPTSKSVGVSDNRLVLGGVEGSNRVYYTKEHRDGEGIGYSDFLSINTGAKGGQIVAVKGFMDRTLVFKESCIGVISGQFALDTGVEVSLKYDVVTEEIGCVSKNAIIEIDKGVIFQSERGLCLIDRNVGVSFIGGPVEDYRENMLSSVSLLSDLQTVVFIGEDTPAIAMNYGKGVWSTFPQQLGYSSTVASGQYYWLSTDNRILKKSSTTLTSGGRFIGFKLRSPWFQVGQLGGFERLYSAAVQAMIAGAYSLKMNVYYDFEEIPRETLTYTSASVGVYGETSVDLVKPLQQVMAKVRYQKCTAVSIEIEELAVPDNYETEYTLHGFRLEIGTKRGAWKYDSSKAFSSLIGG